MWRLIPSLALALAAGVQASADSLGVPARALAGFVTSRSVAMAHPPVVPPDAVTTSSATAGFADSFASPPDSAELHERARRLQDRFETLRRRALPRTADSNRWQECDEVVGRFCLFFGGDSDWEPVPDSPEVLQARGDLLDSLTVVASEIPGDGWVIGQLVQYLGEEGRWSEAREWVDDCEAWEGGEADAVVSVFARARPGWWCHALRGFVLHHGDRYREALAAFERALERMHPDRRERWLNPDPLLDRDADDVWDDAEPGERAPLRARLWALSDPLHMVEGNDRLTEHYARHTISWIREDAENPYGMSWGWDLEELVVRYGAAMGWNRTSTPGGSLRPANVIGHHHPESRRFLPPGSALEDPTAFEEPGWGSGDGSDGGAGADEPTTAYAPPYAPDLRFSPFQLARFRRGEEMIVVAGYRVPPDTAGSSRDRASGSGESSADVRASLFLFGPFGDGSASADDGAAGTGGGLAAWDDASGSSRPRQASHRGRDTGVLSLRVPTGGYMASVEIWDSATARAGRFRRGVRLEPLPPDVAALSDLLIMEPGPDLPEELESAVPRVRPVAEMCPGEEVAVGWEITGIGFRRETLALALRMERTDRGFLSRVGDFLGLTSPPEPVTVEWTEEGPSEPRPFFRSVEVALPGELEPGAYRLSLEARLPDRGPLETERTVRVRERSECGSGR